MADTAWSPIVVDGELAASPGDSVTASKLNISKEEYDEIKEAGSIREKDYPKDVGESESVRERNVRKIAEAQAEAEATLYAEMPDLYDTELTPTTQEVIPDAKAAKEV